MALPFDEGVYMNDGGKNSRTNNIDSYTTRTTKQIRAGQELLQDYSEFVGDNNVEWFDALRSKTFGGNLDFTQQGAPKQQEKLRQQRQQQMQQYSLYDAADVVSTNVDGTLPYSYVLLVSTTMVLVFLLFAKVMFPGTKLWRFFRAKSARGGQQHTQ